MRKIKFRAWHTEDEKMFYSDSNMSIFSWVEEDKQPMETMQYTGLKDEHGVEIYEGDIVRVVQIDVDDFSEDRFLCNAEVVYGNSYYPSSFGLYADIFYRKCALLYNETYILEVIGNIYENPELLKET